MYEKEVKGIEFKVYMELENPNKNTSKMNTKKTLDLHGKSKLQKTNKRLLNDCMC